MLNAIHIILHRFHFAQLSIDTTRQWRIIEVL